MDNELTVILIEDEESECNEFRRYIDSVEGINLLYITNDSGKGVEMVLKLHPDVVILDLELHFGVGSGILFLKDLIEKHPDHKPYILVTTNNISKITHNKIRSMGTDYIISKHQSDYSAKSVVDYLMIMKDAILSYGGESINNINLTPISAVNLETAIANELDSIGVPYNLKGRNYLVEAIKLVIGGQTTDIFAEIGKKYEKSDPSVERAMQTAINKTWRVSSIDDLALYYTAPISSSKGVPTVTEFIFYYANKIKKLIK